MILIKIIIKKIIGYIIFIYHSVHNLSFIKIQFCSGTGLNPSMLFQA